MVKIPGVVTYPLNGAIVGASTFAAAAKWLGHIFKAYPGTQEAAIAGAASFAGIQFLVKGCTITIKKIPYVKDFYAKHCSYKEHKLANMTLKAGVTAGLSTAALYTVPHLKGLQEPRLQAIAFVGGNVLAALEGQQFVKFVKSFNKPSSVPAPNASN